MSMLDRTLFGELRSISTCPTNVLSCRQQLSKEASTRALPSLSVALLGGTEHCPSSSNAGCTQKRSSMDSPNSGNGQKKR